MQQTKISAYPDSHAQLSRTERKKQNRMLKLLETAADVFGEKGYDRTSLEDIAERMDMRAPSLYHYVKTKEELFQLCANDILKPFFANLEKASKSEGSPIQRLEHLFYVQISGQLNELYPDHIPLCVNLTSTGSNLTAYIKDIRKQHVKFFWDLAEEAVTAGELQGQQWQLGLKLALGALDSLHLWYQPENDTTQEEMASDITKSLMKLLVKLLVN